MNRFILLAVLLIASSAFVACQSPLEAIALEALREEWNLTRIGWVGNATDACALAWSGLICQPNYGVMILYVKHFRKFTILY
jgi:hypothetical protein